MSLEGLLFGLFFVGAGIFTICGAACDWDWFMGSRKARFFVAMLGRNGARIFYGLLGIAIILIGLAMAVGLVSPERKRKRFGLGHLNLEQRSNVQPISACVDFQSSERLQSTWFDADRSIRQGHGAA